MAYLLPSTWADTDSVEAQGPFHFDIQDPIAASSKKCYPSTRLFQGVRSWAPLKQTYLHWRYLPAPLKKMADQKAPGGEDSESALLNLANREMSQVEIRAHFLRWMPQEVRDAFTTQFNLSLKASRHLGTMGRLNFDPKTFDLKWEGKQEDLVRLAKDGTLKRLREEIANEEHGAKKRRLMIKITRKLVKTDDETDSETDDEESRCLDKGFLDSVLQKIWGLTNPAQDWDQVATFIECDRYPNYHGLKELTDALEEKVFSHVTRVLVPESADKPYTGPWDGFTRTMLLVTGRISSDAFESGDYEFEKVLLDCEDKSQEGNDAFRMIGVLLGMSMDPDEMETMMKPLAKRLIGLESVAKQIEVHQSIKDFLDGKGSKA
ncbi:hypothetical protein CEP54_001858 [Fusarium duplospermum]|uniref:Uncharacterized protein n=1 Tax=Fusarium duplospermum TaxID=1325734 RepID=A0A428QY68_9HYPO|nr:hypothetical protein CEP54_001858 [Fusarium duplospermum]